MMFLLRLAFWITLICLLLPGSREENSRLISSAERTVSDVRGFCQRNPEVCDDARVTLTSLMTKLKNGAEFMQTWLAQDKAPGAVDKGAGSAPPEAVQPVHPPKLVPRWQDSLNPSDKRPPWRGPAQL
jgi:hypothetical protein